MATRRPNRRFGGRRGGSRRRNNNKSSSSEESKENCLELEGTIHSVLPGTMFRVQLPNEHLVLAHISGKMRKRFIKLVIGDKVKLEMSPYDTDKARIVYRLN